MSKLSTAEFVYAVSKMDVPLINKAFTAWTMVDVFPVPGIPNISA
jgi:hypothetical protein